MRVFKFGGASVKDADGVKNLLKVLQKVGGGNLVIVVSAMGKSTNALEIVVNNYTNKSHELSESVQDVKKFHIEILLDLFADDSNPVFAKVNEIFASLDQFLNSNKSPNYNFVYDQIIGVGELLASTILSAYLSFSDIQNTWLDVRKIIKTDNTYREAAVDWDKTQAHCSALKPTKTLYVTQGFLGSDEHNFNTTLGREGSDYTAAILAYCINAESVTIWKDVPGVMNGDPRYFENTILLEQISYREAIELAFYGATVIHPKTLQPLQRKEIPLFVKSFLEPEKPGTKVGKGMDLMPRTPCYIIKQNQLLLSLSSIDFSFIIEENIAEIFALLHEFSMKVHLIQNSAISFSVCIDDKFGNFQKLKSELSKKFAVSYNENVSLYTIRHFEENDRALAEAGKTVLLKQLSRGTLQLVIKEM